MNTIKNYTTIHLIDMLKVVLSNVVCVPNKTGFKSKHVQHHYKKKQSKTKKQDISCECKCEFDGRKCNSDQNWNIDKCHIK